MKIADIEQGGAYAWRVGQYGATRRCLVLDRRLIFENRYARFWARADNAVSRSRSTFSSRRGRSTGRFLIAIEITYHVDEEGVVWEESGSGWQTGHPARRDLTPGATWTEWVAWGARSVEIIRTWEEQLSKRAEEAEEERVRSEERDRETEKRRRRDAEMRALCEDEQAWRKAWREERDRLLEIETRQRILAVLAERLDQFALLGKSAPAVARMILDTDEIVVDLRKRLPDPVRNLLRGP